MDDNERIRLLKQRALEASGGQMVSWEADNLPTEVREQFWQRVMAFEDGPFTTDFERLREAGIDLPEPASLTDEQLPAKLWEVIEALAELRVFLLSTDHLSDRQLYDVLWRETLHHEIPIEVGEPDTEGGWHADLTATGSEEGTRTWLRYYADEETREHWRRDWPEYDIPEREDPPFDRDRHLPCGSTPRTQSGKC
jgi:hypothetical protein